MESVFLWSETVTDQEKLDKSIKLMHWKEGLLCALLGHPINIRIFQIHCERSEKEAQRRHIAFPGSAFSFPFIVNPGVCLIVTNSDYQPVILPMFLKMVQIFDMDHELF